MTRKPTTSAPPPKKPAPAAVCGTCAYWQRRTAVAGECRRFPPTKNAGASARWVETFLIDFCGEHKPREAE